MENIACYKCYCCIVSFILKEKTMPEQLQEYIEKLQGRKDNLTRDLAWATHSPTGPWGRLPPPSASRQSRPGRWINYFDHLPGASRQQLFRANCLVISGRRSKAWFPYSLWMRLAFDGKASRNPCYHQRKSCWRRFTGGPPSTGISWSLARPEHPNGGD